MIKSLSFVFPMYNERDNIEKTVLLASQIGHKITKDFEIIVVDDASNDGSSEFADQLVRRFPELRVVHHLRNGKLGSTLRTGFAKAKKDWVLYIDADLPIDFKDIKKVVPLTRNADLIIGYRQSRAEPIKREIMSKIYNFIIRTIFGVNVRDVNFSFKLFRRSILQKMTLRSEGSFIDAEFLIQAKKRGYFPLEVGFKYFPRQAGESTLGSFKVALATLKEIWQYLFATNPPSPKFIETIEVSLPSRGKITSIA